MELDIAELHDDLLKEPQITSAKISRIFPSTLSISIQEPQPMLVLRLRDKVKGYQDLLVGRDGMLYQGNGYSSSRLAMLPSLRISPNQLKKSPDDSGYEPLVGMLRVSPFSNLPGVSIQICTGIGGLFRMSGLMIWMRELMYWFNLAELGKLGFRQTLMPIR